MALVRLKKAEKPQPINYTNSIAALIQQRRLQILIHSYIYYRLNDSIVDDYTWSMWAKELVELQNQNPEISKQVIEYDNFKDFDASTGYNLYISNKMREKAESVFEYARRYTKPSVGDSQLL